MRRKEQVELDWQRGWAPQVGTNLEKIRDYWNTYRDLPRIQKYITDEDNVADVGCGISSVLHFFDWTASRRGFDPLADEYQKLYEYPFPVEKTRGEDIGPAYNGTFDVAFCSNCLDHVDEPRRVVGNLARILKDHGILILTVEIDGAKNDLAHPHLFDRQRVVSMVTPHFEVLESWTAPWVGLQRYVQGERSPVATELCMVLRKVEKE